MHIDTSAWGWPQWAFLVWLLLSFLVTAGNHGKERVQWSGPDKGEPERFNGFTALARAAMLIFILIAGGFYA